MKDIILEKLIKQVTSPTAVKKFSSYFKWLLIAVVLFVILSVVVIVFLLVWLFNMLTGSIVNQVPAFTNSAQQMSPEWQNAIEKRIQTDENQIQQLEQKIQDLQKNLEQQESREI